MLAGSLIPPVIWDGGLSHLKRMLKKSMIPRKLKDLESLCFASYNSPNGVYSSSSPSHFRGLEAKARALTQAVTGFSRTEKFHLPSNSIHFCIELGQRLSFMWNFLFYLIPHARAI